MSQTPEDTFHTLTGRIGALITGETTAAAVAEVYAERTDVSFPLTPDVAPLRDRAALERHFAAVAARFAGLVTALRTEHVRLHPAADPEVLVAEFDYVAETPQGPLTLPNAFIMRVRDGQIVESRDYAAA